MIMFLLFACMQKPTTEERIKEVWYSECMQMTTAFDVRLPQYSEGCKDIIMMIDATDPTFFDNSQNAKEYIENQKNKKNKKSE